MDKKFGYYVFGGLLLGAVFGSLWAADGNTLFGMALGALAGAAVGWFSAAAALENKSGKR